MDPQLPVCVCAISWHADKQLLVLFVAVKMLIAVVTNLILSVGVYLSFALAFSLSCVSATHIVDILAMILLSVLVLRTAEGLLVGFVS